MIKSPVRIIIKAADHELLGQLQTTTGLGASELVTVLLRKYGVSFLAWFNCQQGCSYQGGGGIPAIAPPPEPAEPSEEFVPFEL